jgi:glycosyltransferase involved in cell wall biosynthesis
MKVMIDAYNLGLEKGTGVATYAKNLTHGLHALGHEVSVLYGNDTADSASPLLKEIEFFDSPAKPRKGAFRFLNDARSIVTSRAGFQSSSIELSGNVVSESFKNRLPYYDRLWNSRDIYRRSHESFSYWKKILSVKIPERPDVAHWTYPLPLRVKGAKNIYTLHDLVPLRLPYTTLDNKRRYLALCKRIVESADHIITVSECSRRDIINLLGAAPERVSNTYQAVSIPDPYRHKPIETIGHELQTAFGLPLHGYFLYYGAIEPKKNVGRIIEAYLGSNVTTPLVIVGEKAWKSDQELKLLQTSGIASGGAIIPGSKHIVRLDYVAFPNLINLIRGAKATVFPSLYEGFGLPVLESMLLGTPVITSNTSCIPEIAGDAAIMIDPYDTHSIASAMHALNGDENLRHKLSTLGLERAAMFNQSAYVAKLDSVYRRVVGQR